MTAILGINVGHNGSATLLIDGKIVYFCEEERMSKVKYDGNPFRVMIGILTAVQVDHLVICGTIPNLPSLPWTNEDPYTALVRKFYPNVKVHNYCDRHHLTHAATAFYNSGFKSAVAIVVDGAGSVGEVDGLIGYETESMYSCSYPNKFSAVYKRYSDGSYNYAKNGVNEFDGATTITKSYEAVSNYLGFGFIEAGKTMGLSPYGNADNVPKLFSDGKADRNMFTPMYPAGAIFRNPVQADNSWHSDFSKCPTFYKDVAARIQLDTQEEVAELIVKAVGLTNETNVVISGGYGLNCVANYYYKKLFPHLNIYVEPISGDGGCCIGGAKLVHHELTSSNEISQLTTLYLGNRDDLSRLNDYIESTGWGESEVTPADVAKIIADKNIVAMFQGPAEAGPRALGNRSILFDPTSIDGKEFVNKVKGREWFRPFAATVLEEEASKWFDMAGMAESKFMMYAVKVNSPELIPAVTHIDDSCRIQTVSIEDNKNYHSLIKAFGELSGVPVIFNTSFNLAGAPLVDSLLDAFNTMASSDIKYLWLPEINKLITKHK